MDGGAYGAGKAGAPFDPIQFAQRPQTIVRLLCWLFAIIVFGCISSQGWVNDGQDDEVCLYNKDSNACNYGVAIGVIAFLAATVLLLGDAVFPQFSSIKTRRHFVIADLGFSGFWAFLYFVGFCYLCNAWSKSGRPKGDYGVSNMRAAIAFSFFSIFTWAGSAYFAFRQYKQGADQAFTPSYDAAAPAEGQQPNMQTPGAAYSYPEAPDPDGGYQKAPFSGQPGAPTDFAAPVY